MLPYYLLRKKTFIEKIVIVSVAVSLCGFTNQTQTEFSNQGTARRTDTIPQNELFKLKRKDIHVVILDSMMARIIIKSGDTILFNRNDFDALPSQVKQEISANNDGIFTTRNTQAKFPGENISWLRFINHTMRFPQEAMQKNIQGTVVVQFRVDESGNLSDVEAISGPEAGGLRKETVRVLKQSGKWEPATWNGYKVTSYRQQALTFKWEGAR